MSVISGNTASEELRKKNGQEEFAEKAGTALADDELDEAAGGMLMPGATMISGGSTQTPVTVTPAGTRKTGLHGGRNSLIATGDDLLC